MILTNLPKRNVELNILVKHTWKQSTYTWKHS